MTHISILLTLLYLTIAILLLVLCLADPAHAAGKIRHRFCSD